MSPAFSKSVPRAAAVAAISIFCSSAARAQVLRDTRFTVKRGFYDKPFSLEITADDASAVIRFTADGSAPSRTHGRIYSSKLTIDTTTVVRAIAYTPTDETNVDSADSPKGSYRRRRWTKLSRSAGPSLPSRT